MIVGHVPDTYHIAQGTSPENLVFVVNRLRALGWQCVGGLVIWPEPHGSGFINMYGQAMEIP